MESAWLVDGSNRSCVPPDDRGLAYGDGLFETIAAPNGAMRHFDRHYARLTNSCRRLGFSAPERKLIAADIAQLAPNGRDHIVKVIVTRGSGGRGYRPPGNTPTRRMVGIFPWPEYPASHYRNGVRTIQCATQLAENAALAGMKHLGRLEQVLAQQEVAAADAHEGIMLSVGGGVISGTMSNLFIVTDSVLMTPDIRQCGVAGVMRSVIMESARRDGIEVRETDIALRNIEQADEIFLSNSIFGIWPVTVFKDIAFSVGSLTQSLMASPGIHSP